MHLRNCPNLIYKATAERALLSTHSQAMKPELAQLEAHCVFSFLYTIYAGHQPVRQPIVW